MRYLSPPVSRHCACVLSYSLFADNRFKTKTRYRRPQYSGLSLRAYALTILRLSSLSQPFIVSPDLCSSILYCGHRSSSSYRHRALTLSLPYYSSYSAIKSYRVSRKGIYFLRHLCFLYTNGTHIFPHDNL